jgi:hypothetical protein
MPTERFYSIERVERRVAVLLCGTERVIVPLDQLPPHIDEGAVLGVEYDENGSPDWRSAKLDPAEKELWKREAEKLLAEAMAKQAHAQKRDAS